METDKFFPNISPTHFAMIEATMLLPCALSALLLWYYGLPMITLIIYILLCCLIIPGLYVKYNLCTFISLIIFSFVHGWMCKQQVHITATFSNCYLSMTD